MAKGKCDKVWGNQQNLVWKKFRVWRHHRPQESLPDFCVCPLFCRSHVENVVKAWGMNSWEMDQMKDQDSEYSQTH